jgi:hypothetical protein
MSLDLVVVALIVTFVVMMATGAAAVLSRRPPLHRQTVACPEDGSQALVGAEWDRAQHRMVIGECDHPRSKSGHCHKTCEAYVQRDLSELTVQTVLP